MMKRNFDNKKAAAQFGDEPAALSKKITKEILT